MGGGASRSNCKKTALTAGFPSPQLILKYYSGLPMVYLKENYNFRRFQRGSNIVRGGGGGPTFFKGGGSHFFQWGGGGWGFLMLNCIEIHRTCDFPAGGGGGGSGPLSPHWIHT